jgi:hypothetical protein
MEIIKIGEQNKMEKYEGVILPELDNNEIVEAEIKKYPV